MGEQIFTMKMETAKPTFTGTMTDSESGNTGKITKASELIDFITNNFKSATESVDAEIISDEKEKTRENQKFIIGIKSTRPPVVGTVIDNISGNTLEFKIAGMLINFVVKNHIPDEAEIEARIEADKEKEELEKKKKKDFSFPPRIEIKEALSKVSNFTELEMQVLSWSTMYKCYSLMERYGQEGVEDEIRAEGWMEEAIEEFKKTGITATGEDTRAKE